MHSVSFRDVLFVLKETEGIKANEITLLNPEMDIVVAPILYELGIDTKQPFTVSATKHRCLNNEVGIGYRYDGRMRLDREWTSSKGCDVMSRISATAYKDITLTKELCGLIGTSVDFTGLNDASVYSENDFPNSLLSPTYEEDSATIKMLNEVALKVRGEITV